MGKLSALLSSRLNMSTPSLKMAHLAEQSATGALSTFQGVFHPGELTELEKEQLESILTDFAKTPQIVEKDLKELMAITSEVKAINHQSALLHGERIQKAQNLLKKYQEGAFSAWLLITYGNRQTPYNLLQYFEFYKEVPDALKAKLEAMPRQAVYTLASREGDFNEKLAIIKAYQKETKAALLKKIRDCFPLSDKDKRAPSYAAKAEKLLLSLVTYFESPQFRPTERQRGTLKELLQDLQSKL